MLKQGDVIKYRFDDGIVKGIVMHYDEEYNSFEFLDEDGGVTLCYYKQDDVEGRIEKIGVNVWSFINT